MLKIKKSLDNLIIFLREKTENFIYSYFFPTITALISLLFWIADLQLIGFTIVAIITCFVLIVFDDFLPIVPLVFIIPMCFRIPSVATTESPALVIALFALIFLFIGLHFLKHPVKIEIDKFFYMLLGVLALFLIAGIFYGDFSNYFEAIDLVAISTLAPLAIHFFLYNKIKLSDKVDYKRYFCFCFICATALAAVQLSYVYFYIKFVGRWPYGSMPGGYTWANSNHVANLILIAVPLCCYMMLSSKRIWAWFITLIFLYVAVYFSQSDGGLATLITFTPFLMYAVYKNAYRHNKTFLRYTYFVLISAVLLAIAILGLFFYEELIDFIISSSSSNGRTHLYNLALECFAKKPIFGIGFGNGKICLDLFKESPENCGYFHSTFFHVLACAGSIGIIVYTLYYVVRIKYLAKGNTLLGHFALFSFLAFAVYGIIDNGEFNIVLMFMATVITTVGLFNKKGSDDKPLPLYVNIPKF